jgi:threonine/homoserine/homoserine lactone efflux protein
MGSLIGALAPFALGTFLSPLAVVAMIAILLSHHPGSNGLAFLIGWTIAVVGIVVAALLIAGTLTVQRPADPPGWVPGVHLAIGAILVLSGVWMLRRGRHRVRQMAAARSPEEIVAAAPQLPGWLKSVEQFSARRSLILGFALCAINPVDLSCLIGAGVELRVLDASGSAKVISGVLFCIISILPAAIPFAIYAGKGAGATETLTRLRGWIAAHNGAITAGMVIAIGALQLYKGFDQL